MTKLLETIIVELEKNLEEVNLSIDYNHRRFKELEMKAIDIKEALAATKQMQKDKNELKFILGIR